MPDASLSIGLIAALILSMKRLRTILAKPYRRPNGSNSNIFYGNKCVAKEA